MTTRVIAALENAAFGSVRRSARAAYRRLWCLGPATIMAIAATAGLGLRAEATTWTGSGDGTSWTETANWGGNPVPAAGGTATFNSTATGVTLLGDREIANLDVGLDGTGSFEFTDDFELAVTGTTFVGRRTSADATGTWTVSTGAVTLGSDGSPGDLYIGRDDQNTGVATGTLNVNGGQFRAHLTEFQVGDTTAYNEGGYGVGTFNASSYNGSSLLIDTANLWIANGSTLTSQPTSGTVTLGNTSNTATQRINVATGMSIARDRKATGTFTLNANGHLAVGTPESRAFTLMGVFGSYFDGRAEGSLTANGGTFELYGSTLRLGQTSTSTGTNIGVQAAGTLDLNALSFGGPGESVFDVDTVDIASFGQDGARREGTLLLGAGTVRMGTLTLSRTTGVGAGSFARLDLNGTLATVDTSVAINNLGDVNVFVNGSDAGFSLPSSAGALAINSGGRMDIDFDNPTDWTAPATAETATGIYYGLKWGGDHATTLTNLLNTRLFLTDSFSGAFASAAPEIFYDEDTDATYVGIYVVPEPTGVASIGVAVAAGLLLLRRAGRRRI
jgi:hypothetical protein